MSSVATCAAEELRGGEEEPRQFKVEVKIHHPLPPLGVGQVGRERVKVGAVKLALVERPLFCQRKCLAGVLESIRIRVANGQGIPRQPNRTNRGFLSPSPSPDPAASRGTRLAAENPTDGEGKRMDDQAAVSRKPLIHG